MRGFAARLLLLVPLGLAATAVQAEDSVKIGLIEPFSGPIAAVGRDTLEGFEYYAGVVNARGGVLGGRTIEVVPLDNAMNAEKTTQQLRTAIDDGLRFVSQGVGSNHALNIIKFLGKHNRRNPDQSILFLNHSAVTTAFTNELCSFWHVRFDANVDMKVAALATQISRDPGVSKLYMINQNYAYGQSFQAAAQKFLGERAPNVELVGDELIVPFGKVLDFTPYIAKIKASGADTVLTGNWGPDLIRFVKAAAAAGLKTPFYTIYGGIPSSIAGIGGSDGMAVGLKQLTEMHENDPKFDTAPADIVAMNAGWTEYSGKSQYADRIGWVVLMFAQALEKAGSDDPAAVAAAFEGLTYEGPAGPVMIRADDHQAIFPMVISSMTDQAKRPFLYNGESFGVAWQTDAWVTAEELALPTTCEMKRP
jgi:branched-chain amino acid transport system substrate-binding protein